MDHPIAILGSPNAIGGFKALGVRAWPVATAEQGREVLQQIAASECAILLITEDWADQLRPELDELRTRALPAVTVVPGPTGSTGAGDRELRRIVERAVGSDILFKNDK
ncbi:MAG: V-type ATP synthase subunit F [Candidatus Nomurabacteria bacterium]|nr:MAG: V-type ATP synthase subunit F [Candidatus Nomurabacteria bacterium]